MDIEAMHLEIRRRGIEVLIAYAALLAAIDGISVIAAKPRNIEAVRTRADLLVGCEADRDASMRAVLMRSTIVIISATPALSSPPSSVVPSAVISVRPASFFRCGKSATYNVRPLSLTSPPS